MTIGLNQNLRLQQQLIMTPQLKMAIRLLQVSRMELVDMINAELETNPTLEQLDGTNTEESQIDVDEMSLESEPREVDILEKFENDDIDWSNYWDDYQVSGNIFRESEQAESPDYELFTPSRSTLSDHLNWQLLMLEPSSEEKRIGSMIIGNLNSFGYLDVSVEEIARMTGSDPVAVESMLKRIQEFDPPGICARNLSECLLIQIRQFGIDDPIIEKIASNHIRDLANKRYKAIAQALGTDVKIVKTAVAVIKQLDPRPADRYTDVDHIYITPDVYVYKDGDDYAVRLNDDSIPPLYINGYYRKMVKRSGHITKGARSYLRERLRSAQWLIKSIRQRQQTIYNVTKSIVKFQRDFFDHGIAHLKPLILRDVAEDIGMHESTVSRVTTNKYAHTPHGIFELKFFFNSSIGRDNGDPIASVSVKEKIRQIIAKEDPKKPMSDNRIVELLSGSGIRIARRTVAKYREMMGILPSSKRKQL